MLFSAFFLTIERSSPSLQWWEVVDSSPLDADIATASAVAATTRIVTMVPVETLAVVAAPPAAPAALALAMMTASLESTVVARATVSPGAALSDAKAVAANPGNRTILKTKTTKVTSAVFQFINIFIARAPFLFDA
jgi:hypothetical protein